MWTKDYAEVYGIIKSCPSWPNHLKNIMNLILEHTRNAAAKLITKAYSTIHVSQASRLMGFTKDEMVAWVLSNNWTYEEDTGFIVVVKGEGDDSKLAGPAVVENRTDLLEKLTDYIIFLESSQTAG